MIVPDKKTEAYLNEPVSPKGILRLCRAGVLSPFDFLRASALCRSDRKWSKFILLILRFLSGLSMLSAVFFLMISRWGFFYQTGGFVLLCVLFVCCACFRFEFVIVDYVGAFLIGAMIFLSDLCFRTNSFLYEQFFLWFFLLFLWNISSRHKSLWLMDFVILNGAICLYGIQFALPSFVFTPTTFFILSALFNLLCWAAYEVLSLKFYYFDLPYFRFFPLAGTMLFLSAAAAFQCFPPHLLNWADISFVLCAICSCCFGYMFIIRKPDKTGRRMTGLFCVCWGSLLLYRCIYAVDFSTDLQRALFCTAVSLLMIVALIRERLYVTRVKGEKDAL